MRSIESLKISPKASIKDALSLLDMNAVHIVLVVDDNDVLLGVVADGDIRRAILNKMSLESPVTKVMTLKPIVISEGESIKVAISMSMKHKIYQIPVVDEHNRVVDIKLIDDLLKPVRKNKVVLMVGGLGTRLRPLTDNIPKPMLEVGDKPILETIINRFKSHGFEDFIFCVNYKSELIQEYFKDGKSFGVTIQYIHEQQRMGTAGALSLIKGELTTPFFVMNGDLLTNVNFEYLLNYHESFNSTATMCVREYHHQVPFGVVEIERGSEIVGVVEKPTHKFFVSAGIYVCDPDVLDFIPNDEFYDMPTLFEKVIANNMKAVSFPVHEYWLDIGRLEDYKRANDEYDEVFGK